MQIFMDICVCVCVSENVAIRLDAGTVCYRVLSLIGESEICKQISHFIVKLGAGEP